MRVSILLAALVGSLIAAAPARATYVDVTYSGTVAQVAATGLPTGVGLGTTITFDVVFDTAKLVDRTASLNQSFGGNPSFSSALFASLSDDPLASLSIQVGSVTFSKFDQRNYGTTAGLAGGDLPAAEYLNGSFAGVGNIFVNSQGYTLDADPIADAVSRARQGYAFRVNAPGDYDFVLSLGTAARPFGTALAAGNIDTSSIQINAVPEPSTLALLLAGATMVLGLTVPRRRSPPETAA